MARKIISVVGGLLFFFLLSLQLAGAQAKKESSPWFKISKSGLEIQDYKKVVFTTELSEFYSEESGGGKIGLTEVMVRNACESRLRDAGLESLSGFSRPEYLSIQINIKYRSFSILIQFNRPVLYPVGDKQYMKYGAKTWQKNILGQHGYSAEYIMESLDKLLEDFIADYVKANTE